MIWAAEGAGTSYAAVQAVRTSQDAGPAKQRLSQRQIHPASQSVEQQQSSQPSQSQSTRKEQQRLCAASSQGLSSPCHQFAAAAQLPPSDAIPDTPGACQTSAAGQDLLSGHAQADLQGATAKQQSKGVISVEADASAVQAASEQLAELELTPLKQLLKLCGQTVSHALHKPASLSNANVLH